MQATVRKAAGKAKESDAYRTDPDFYALVKSEFPLDDYDPCEITPEGLRLTDGLGQTPDDVHCYFMNFPYSDPYPWTEKAKNDQARGITAVVLAKLDWSTEWWRDNVEDFAEIRKLLYRPRFRKCNSNEPNPHSCAIKECGQPGNFASVLLVYHGFIKGPDGIMVPSGIVYPERAYWPIYQTIKGRQVLTGVVLR